MQLTLERPDYEYFLRGADGRGALVNERRLQSSFIVAPDTLIENWSVTDASRLNVQDLQPLLELQPELVLLGSGDHQSFPPADVMAMCLGRGVGLDTMTNAAAARTYNVLAGEGRRVVAGFILAGGTQ